MNFIRLKKSLPKNSKIYGYFEQVEIDVRKKVKLFFFELRKLKDVIMTKKTFLRRVHF